MAAQNVALSWVNVAVEWTWSVFFTVYDSLVLNTVCVHVLSSQESYRNEAEVARTSARDTATGLGIALGCVLLYAVVMSIVASRDCIRQRCRTNVCSKPLQSNDASITSMNIFCCNIYFLNIQIRQNLVSAQHYCQCHSVILVCMCSHFLTAVVHVFDGFEVFSEWVSE